MISEGETNSIQKEHIECGSTQPLELEHVPTAIITRHHACGGCLLKTAQSLHALQLAMASDSLGT